MRKISALLESFSQPAVQPVARSKAHRRRRPQAEPRRGAGARRWWRAEDDEMGLGVELQAMVPFGDFASDGSQVGPSFTSDIA